MKDVYNRVSVDDDQRFDCHVLLQTKLSPIRLLYLVTLSFIFVRFQGIWLGTKSAKVQIRVSKWVSSKLAPEAIIDDVIEYPEMLMARTGLNRSLALGAKANIMIQIFIIFVKIAMNNGGR